MHRDLVQSVIGKIFIAQKWDNDIFEAFESLYSLNVE